MGKKVGFGYKIDEKYVTLHDELHNQLGGNKYRIIEASLELFNAIPMILQLTLVSYNEQQRQQILDIIAQVSMPTEPKKGGKKR